MVKVLSFDQSTSQTGWALGWTSQGLRDYTFSSFRTPKSDVFGERLRSLHLDFEALIKRHEPDLVAFEEPFFPVGNGAKKDEAEETHGAAFNVEIIKKLHMVAGCLMTVAALYGVPCESYASSSWRTTFLGRGRAPWWGEMDPKKASLKRARQLGYDVKSHDESDAIGVLTHALHGAPAVARSQGDLLGMVRI